MTQRGQKKMMQIGEKEDIIGFLFLIFLINILKWLNDQEKHVELKNEY